MWQDVVRPRGLCLRVPKVGGRVLKTAIAITLSVATAQALGLTSAQFAGIVAVLGVQPSLFRSLRDAGQHLLGAGLGVAVGVTATVLFQQNPLMMGAAALAVMLWHVATRRTSSLLVAVVLALNTMQAAAESAPLGAALNQLGLVVIGLAAGTLVNLLFKFTHAEACHDKLLIARAGVVGLLRSLVDDCRSGTPQPYPAFRVQIDRVRTLIDEGKRVSQYVREDSPYLGGAMAGSHGAFQTLESMVERLRDVSKGLQQLEGEGRYEIVSRVARVTLGIEERMAAGFHPHLDLADAAFRRAERMLRNPLGLRTDRDFHHRSGEYFVYLALRDYYLRLKLLHLSKDVEAGRGPGSSLEHRPGLARADVVRELGM